MENSQLKIDVDDARTRLLIAENKAATIQHNHENIVGALRNQLTRLQSAALEDKQPKAKDASEDVVM